MVKPFTENAALQAVLWMSGAIVSFSALAVAGRAVSLDHDTFELMLFRSVIGIGIVVTFAGYFGTLSQISFDRIGLHATRNLCHFAGQNLWFYALTLLPLAHLFALEFTSPIWVMILAAALLGEKITKVRAGTALLGFIGVIFVARPDLGGIQTGTVIATLAAIGFAGSAIATKLLTKSASITCILFWLTVMQAAFGLITAGFDGDIAFPNQRSLPWILVIAMCGLAAHFCLTKALTLAPASIVMPVDFLRLPVIAVIGMVFYNEPIVIWVFIGGSLIFLANLMNIRAEARRPKSHAEL